VESDEGNSHILKIHGQGWHDLYIQVANKETMEIWQECFEPCDAPSSQDKCGALDGDIQEENDMIGPDSSFSHDVLLLPLDHSPQPTMANHPTNPPE
jgi:hypothetical protein